MRAESDQLTSSTAAAAAATKPATGLFGWCTAVTRTARRGAGLAVPCLKLVWRKLMQDIVRICTCAVCRRAGGAVRCVEHFGNNELDYKKLLMSMCVHVCAGVLQGCLLVLRLSEFDASLETVSPSASYASARFGMHSTNRGTHATKTS
jgi:hypothetical protein